MRALPDDGGAARCDGDAVPPLEGTWTSLGVVRHGFTHFDLELQLMLFGWGDCARLAPENELGVNENGEWWPVADLASAGLPTLFAKAAQLALATMGESTHDIA